MTTCSYNSSISIQSLHIELDNNLTQLPYQSSIFLPQYDFTEQKECFFALNSYFQINL